MTGGGHVAPGFVVEVVAYDDPVARRLVTEVQEEYVERYGGPDGAQVAPGEFDAPDGLFVVGLLDGVAVASGGWRRLDAGTAEIKRMYVRAGHRRRGLARRVLRELEATARAAGFERVVLNTGRAQPEAIGLYRAAGYTPVAPFGHYAATPGALFFGIDLR